MYIIWSPRRLRRNDTSLRSIDLSADDLGDISAFSLSEAVKCNGSVTALVLERNRVGCDGAARLAEALTPPPRPPKPTSAPVTATATALTVVTATGRGGGEEGDVAANAIETATTTTPTPTPTPTATPKAELELDKKTGKPKRKKYRAYKKPKPGHKHHHHHTMVQGPTHYGMGITSLNLSSNRIGNEGATGTVK